MLHRYFRSLVHLFFPELCMGCNNSLVEQEEMVCTSCLFHLPKTDFHLDCNNDSVQLLKGKFQFKFACSMLYLSSGSLVERLIYNLKYNNHPQVGYYFGRLYGKDLLDSPFMEKIDLVVPIPLHRKRLNKRGYNQSEYFARGLAKSLGSKVDSKTLIRRTYQSSQTKLLTFERVLNVEDAFQCNEPEKFGNKNILLVDDVLTTGSTIASAANELNKSAPSCKIYIASLARAKI